MSETGHAKNVANFETIIIILVGLGTIYNPSQTLILLSALEDKLVEAKDVLDAVDEAEAVKKIDVNERQAEFGGIVEYVVNIKRTAEVDINNAAFNADLLTIVRKFRGAGGGGKKDNPATPDKDESKPQRSVSQRSYDNLIAHFAELIALLKTQPAYNPNDEEMKIPALEAKLAAMREKNNRAKASIAALGNAQYARDEVLYNKETGVLKLVKLVKTQLARKPGRNSAAYQQINALEFRKY